MSIFLAVPGLQRGIRINNNDDIATEEGKASAGYVGITSSKSMLMLPSFISCKIKNPHPLDLLHLESSSRLLATANEPRAAEKATLPSNGRGSAEPGRKPGEGAPLKQALHPFAPSSLIQMTRQAPRRPTMEQPRLARSARWARSSQMPANTRSYPHAVGGEKEVEEKPILVA